MYLQDFTLFENVSTTHDYLLENYINERIICEEKHISKQISDISDDLTEIIIKFAEEYRNKDIRGINVERFSYWSFTSNEDRDPKRFQDVGHIPPLFVKTFLEQLYHPIYIRLVERMNVSTKNVVAALANRDVQNVIYSELARDRITIIVNLENYYSLNLDDALIKDEFISVIAHELMHAQDAYIRRYDNILMHKKNMLYRGFVYGDNTFNLNEYVKNELSILFYYMAPEEQRAHLNQLDNILTKYENNHSASFHTKLKDELLKKLNTKGIAAYAIPANYYTVKRELAVCAILQTDQIENITRLYHFYE